MKQSENSDFSKANFDNFAKNEIEYTNLFGEYKERIDSLNSNSEHTSISDEDAERVLVARLQNVLQLPKSSVGLLFASIQILNDWEKLGEIGLHLGDWVIQISNLTKKLKQESDLETDRLQTKALRNPILKLVSKNSSYDYSATQKNLVLAIRGLVIYQALLENKKPGIELTKSLTKLFDKKSQFEEISNLNITSIREYVPGNIEDDHVVLLCTLKKLFLKPLVNLAHFAKPKKVLSIQSTQHIDNQSLVNELHENELKDGKNSSEKYKTDLINYITYCQQFMGEKENVGIIERYDYVQKFEIEIVIPEIIEDLKDANYRKVALATLLTFLLHCRPKRFGLIGLMPTSTTTAWLDLKDGCYCWELNAVTEKTVKEAQDKTVVYIPLPNEIVGFIRQLYDQYTESAVNLGDLFDCDLTELDADCKQYLKSKSLSTHRLTISKLEGSYSRYILSHADDEVYAAVIGLDFCIGTMSNFNYCVIRGSKLTKILLDVYRKLGFIEHLITPPKDVGSKVGLSYEKVWALAESLSVKAHQTIMAVPKNISFQNLIQAHNDLATSIGTLTAIFTGHRAAEAYGFARHTIDLKRKLCIICDKRVTDYQWTRVVPIPTLIASWLDFYLSWLKSMKYRLSTINKKLAFQVEAALNSTSDQSHPLFFTIYSNQIKPFSSKDFSLIADDFNLPTNCGRHFIDYLLRNGELDSAHVMAFEGHANSGQEPFGPTSLMSLVQVAETIRCVLDHEINVKKLMIPPKFNPRQINYSDFRFPKMKFMNLITDEYAIKNPRAAQCPYDEDSFESLNAVNHYQKKWTALEGDIILIDLVYSLCLIDGIACEVELQEVINQIILGEIYVLDDNFYVDSVSKKLGIRRIWISFGTVLIAAAVAETVDDKLLKLSLNNDDFKSLCERLLNSVATHYSIYAPSMLAAWARGEICSRSTRPETLARHHFNCIEKPNFNLVESKRTQVILDDDLIRKAINRACDNSQNLGTNETRLKNLLDEISTLLDCQIDDLPTLILARFTQYLINVQVATTTINRYYSVIRQFLEYFLDEISDFGQLAQVDWSDIVKNWVNAERIDSDSGPETAAVNHFLIFVSSDIKIKGNVNDLNSAVMEYADFPSQNEISRSVSYIKSNPEIDEATKLKAILMAGHLAQYAIRPSEVRSIRLCDVYLGEPEHIVITSEAIGKVKTSNANRVMLLKDDEFSTKEHLIHLCCLKEGFPKEAFIFGDSVDGSTQDGSQLLFNVVHDALSRATGNRLSIMSFRHFNVSRDVNLAIDGAGKDALKDRKILSVIAANSGHGHAKTSLQNYCCDLDKQRHKFWDQQLSNQKIRIPISEIKKRLGLNFTGNLPLNHSSFLILMQILRVHFAKTHLRIKDCHDFILKNDCFLVSSAETNYKYITASFRYCFHKFADADSELAVFESNILEREKYILDQGIQYLRDTLNKDWGDSQIIKFRPMIQSQDYSKFIYKIGIMTISDRDAIQVAQVITDLYGKWEIKNLKILDFLERHLPIFFAANINVEMVVNQNLQVNIRKSLRQKPFIKFSEKPMARDVYCQVSFWDTNLKSSLRARHHQEIMVKINLFFLTKAILVLGKLNAY